MRLTKDQKDLFVHHVMQDVPEVDYLEPFKKAVQADMVDTASPALKAALLNPEVRAMLLNGTRAYSHPSGYYSFTSHMSSVACYDGYKPSDLVLKKLDQIVKQFHTQNIARAELEKKIYSQINSCSTLATAKVRLSEFADYLPSEGEKTANLPAVVDLVDDFKKAGWPEKKSGGASA